MYKLRIRLDSDGDFYHKCKLLNNDKNEIIMYYNYRSSAIVNIKSFYEELVDTIGTSKDYIYDVIDIIKKFKDYISMITDKIDSFCLYFELGNSDFEIELCKIKPEQLNDDAIVFNEDEIKIFYINKNFIRDFDWDILSRIPNIDIDEDDKKIILRFGRS